MADGRSLTVQPIAAVPDRSGTTPSAGALGPGHLAIVGHLAPLIVVLVAVGFPGPDVGLSMIAVSSGLFASAVVLQRGGAYLVPSSVFFLASGVFIGLAVYYLQAIGTDVDPAVLLNAAALALGTTVGISFFTTVLTIRWRLEWPDRRARARFLHGTRPAAHFQFAAVVLLVLSQVPIMKAQADAFSNAVGLGGTVMIVLAASSHRVGSRRYGDWFIVVLAFVAPIVWITLSFSGSGRITVAGLGIASMVGWNLIRPHPVQKLVPIVLIPLFLAFSGVTRLELRQDGGTAGVSSSSIIAEGHGLASLYSPLLTWAEVIEPKSDEDASRLGPRYGATFVNTVLLPIPRSAWAGKPTGFGAELVDDLQITGGGENFSIAALIQGEWYANFGYWGLLLMMPAVGWAMAALDRIHARLVRSQLRRRADWWNAAALMCCVSSLADLYWVGTFTWYARGGLAAVVVYLLGRVLSQRRPRSRLSRRPQRITLPTHADAGAARA